jgi:hypothetical protein
MKKRCHRKIWSTQINPVAHAIAGAAITDSKTLDKLRLLELASLEAMCKGQATVEDWRTLVDMMNISETMGRNGIGPEILPHIDIAHEEMRIAAERYKKTKRMGVSGVGIKALREIYEYHDLQRTSVARSVYESMIEKTKNIINSGSAKVVHV